MKILTKILPLCLLVLVSCKNDSSTDLSANAPTVDEDNVISQSASISEDTVISLSDGMVLTIPAGALETETEITITKTSQSADSSYGPLSTIYIFTPSGLEFKTPATIEMPYDPAQTTAETPPAIYWSRQDDENSYELLDTDLGSNGNTVTANIRHFSDGFVGLFDWQKHDCLDLAAAMANAYPNHTIVFGKAEFLGHDVRPIRGAYILATYDQSSSLNLSTDAHGCYAAPVKSEARSILNVSLLSLMSGSVDGELQGITAGQFESFAQNCTDKNWKVSYSTSVPFGGSTYNYIDINKFPSSNDTNTQFVVIDFYSRDSGIPYFTAHEIETAFSALDAIGDIMNMVCQAEPNTVWPQLSIYRTTAERTSYFSDVENKIVFNDYSILEGDTTHFYIYSRAAHEMAHYLQENFYTLRDYDRLMTRVSANDHTYGTDMDARFAFSEGFADGMAGYITHKYYGYSDYDVLGDIGTFEAISHEENVAYIIKNLIETNGYSLVDTVYRYDMPSTPAFQTIHSFGYYYKNRGGVINTYFSTGGIPDEALDDLYDQQNYLNTVSVNNPLYVPVVHYTSQLFDNHTDTETPYPNDWDLVWGGEGSGGAYLGADYGNPDGDVISIDENGDYWASLYLNDDVQGVYGLGANWSTFVSDVNFFLPYHRIENEGGEFYQTSKYSSRWFYAEGDDFKVYPELYHQWDMCDIYSFYHSGACQATSPVGCDGLDHPSSCNPVMKPLRIADDANDCTDFLYMDVYKNGELYAHREGTCADDKLSVELEAGQQYIVDVYAQYSDTSKPIGLTSCFGFMQEDFCAKYHYNLAHGFNYTTNCWMDDAYCPDED